MGRRANALNRRTALQMIAGGAIQDGKTIMLLQHAAIVGLEKLRHTPLCA
jgi:hypothetical protein